jgi:leucyl-tRNA synthetase
MYVGGAEHAVLHLLYARFWHKVLYDLGVVTTKEPFHCLKNQGLILAEDGQKMSKSKGNVINPDEIISVHGADVLRVYEMFMGPFDQKVAWDTKGILGIKRFLQRVWTLCQEDMVEGEPLPRALEQIMHKTIGAVTRDIEHFQFNTAISHLMVFSNELVALDRPPKEALRVLVLLLAPFAPFLAEELWETLGNVTFLYTETWPTFDPKLAEKDEIELVLQINGKVRAKLSVPASITEEEAITMALHEERIEKQCAGKQILKTIYVPKKLVNIVIAS